MSASPAAEEVKRIDLPPAPELAPDIARALREFHLVRNPILQRTIQFYPAVAALLLVIDFIFFQGQLALRFLPLTANYVLAAVAGLLFIRLFGKLPEALKIFWARGVLYDSTGARVSAREYAKFIREFDANLNARWGWILGLAGLTLVNVPLFLWSYQTFPLTTAAQFVVRLVFDSGTWFLVGPVFWRVLIVGYMISRVSARFDLAVQPIHPDESGGLRPLGDLCLDNALVVMIPALYFAVWVAIFISVTPADIVSTYPQLLVFKPYFAIGLFQLGMIAQLLAGLIAFLLPLYGIHRDMLEQREIHQERLGALARRMDEINATLLDPTHPPESPDAQKHLDALKWMRLVYDDNSKFPTWPFNREIALKLTTSQIIPLLVPVVFPILGSFGVGKPILDLIKSVLGAIP